jgi:hypothetical protein
MLPRPSIKHPYVQRVLTIESLPPPISGTMLPRLQRRAAAATSMSTTMTTRTMWMLTFLAATFGVVLAQNSPPPPVLNSSFPHAYPGIPNTNGNFSDSAAWQKCACAPPRSSHPLLRHSLLCACSADAYTSQISRSQTRSRISHFP